MGEVASLIAEVLANTGAEEKLAAVRGRVESLTNRFPLYQWKLRTAATG
jgi:glycine/serine hydroxymethyltransferase